MSGPYDWDDDEGGAPPAEPPTGGGGIAVPPTISDDIGSAGNWGDFSIGLRCTICAVEWPLEDPTLFGLSPNHHFTLSQTLPCPVCEEEMRIFSNLHDLLPLAEAWSLVKHKRFADYYERTRGVPLED